MREEMVQIKKGVVPEQMEDKWFIYYSESCLHFVRNWTGFTVFIVRFREEDEKATAIDFSANRDPAQYTETNDESDKETLSYLIDALLLHRPAQFPGSGGPLGAWAIAGRASLGQHPN